MSENNNNKKSYLKSDILFYGIISALGVGLTTLCVYGYRKYQDYCQNSCDTEFQKLDLGYFDEDYESNENIEKPSYKEDTPQQENGDKNDDDEDNDNDVVNNHEDAHNYVEELLATDFN